MADVNSKKGNPNGARRTERSIIDFLKLGTLNLAGNKFKNLAPPTDPLDAATKEYADSVAGGGVFQRAYRSTDGTPVNNSIALVADPILKFAIGANEVWQFSMNLLWIGGGGVSFLKTAFSGPSGVVLVRISLDDLENGTGSTITDLSQDSGLLNDGNIPQENAIRGLIINGPNAGTIQLKIAQENAVAVNTYVTAGSYLIAQKMN